MSVPYVCCNKRFEDYYVGQTGSGLPYYTGGVSLQKGYGIGGVFRSLFRSALPFLMKGAKTVGKEALLTGTRVVNDVLAGQSFKNAAKQRTQEAGRELVQKAVNKAKNMMGSGRYKRKRVTSRRIRTSKVRKVQGRDIFGP